VCGRLDGWIDEWIKEQEEVGSREAERAGWETVSYAG
jgi:hypothetical protein